MAVPTATCSPAPACSSLLPCSHQDVPAPLLPPGRPCSPAPTRTSLLPCSPGRPCSQFDQRKAEPNSGLGKAITYLLRHWRPLTLFLRVAGAPVDNNIVERALKRAILHRKNALFYKTLNGAQVGDLFMTLIHTCQLCGANSFDYMTELQRHAQQLAASPAQWMPWNYRETLARTVPLSDSS